MLQGKRILLIISGGIAAYKCLELIRRLRERGAAVRCVLTKAAAEFVTPLSVAALSGDKVYGDIFSLTDEHEMGHIQLSRDADLLVVVPATANIIARMAQGIADDLATTVLLATDKDVMAAPSMNVRMWEHAATQQNVEILRARGIRLIGPVAGDMACGEYGDGRMASGGAACPRHQRADARADRSGALYRQPLVRQTGARDCRRAGAVWRGDDTGHRPDRRAGPDRRLGDKGGIGARHAGRL
jgi:phosphopantothenoylcysteine synthetase/decarboxylase